MPAPGAPIHMIMNPTAQWVFTTLHFAIAIALTAWILLRWDRDNATLAILILIGGGLSIFAEPFFDRLGFIWHATVGQWTFATLFGHSVPLWMLPVYYWFIGGQTIFVLHRIRAGATARDLRRLYYTFCAMDAILELPILYAGGVYTYFGHQPFYQHHLFPLPGWYIALNGILPLAGAATVKLLQSLGDRRYLYATPLALPMATYAIYPPSAWPVWAALNTHTSTPITWLAGTLTIALGLATMHILTTICAKTTTPTPTPQPARTPSQTTTAPTPAAI